MSSTESVKVAVRVRPFNGREKDRNATCIIRMFGPKTVIINPDTQEEKEFAFDFSFWSHDGMDVLNEPEPDLGLPGGGYNAPTNRRGGPTASAFGCEYASQQEVYSVLGTSVLNNALDGFNCCLFAYGQTGSGKSYSFVGYGTNKGIVPQVCDAIFKRKVDIEASGTTQLQVTFSMMEIYNEKIRDLLNPDAKTNNDLKVRTTPKGTYVEGCKAKAVSSFDAINREMENGTASRTVAATQMNATSSRAHTVMTITVKQIITEDGRKKEIASDMNLVDLAGSERAESTGATGDRLKEGAAINKSLSSLGNVISALAEQANNPKKKVFVPYRDSKLTQILQSALGGNSKTIMVAALSPADINFEETLSTLRYADRAKQIKVVVEVQENPTDKLIRQLKEENEKLRKMMEQMGGDGFDPAAFAKQQQEAAGGGGGGGGGGASGEPPAGTITEEEMQAAIEKAVSEVKAASAADKAKALEALKAEMMARHEGLTHGMISRSNFEQTLKDAIKAVGGKSDAEKEKAVEAMLRQVEVRSAQRAADGGKLGVDDALRAGDEALRDIESKGVPEAEAAAARAKKDEVLGAASKVWADGLLEEEEYMAMIELIAACMPALSAEHKDKFIEHARYAYHTEQEAAKADMHSKQELAQVAAEVVKPLGGDVKAAVISAELRFDQLLRDAEDGAVDEGVMTAMLGKVMGNMTSTAAGDKKAAMMMAKRAAGWNTAKNLNAAADAQTRARMQIMQAMAKNAEMMAGLEMSFDEKLGITETEAKEQQEVLKSLGLGGISKEEMKVTPSLSNLNQDPAMADSLVYFLASGETVITTLEDSEEYDNTIQLSGGGIMAGHGAIFFSRAESEPIRFMCGSGAAFVNGQPVAGEEPIPLRHNDRLILGNAQAFRVVDPLDPEASKPKQIIDWDLAQTELAVAMGTAVDLKVEEEVAKKKAELDAQLKAMEEKFAKENEALRAALAAGGGSAASKEGQLAALDTRKRAIETFRSKAKIHVNEYKRDLIRLEDSLKKVMPLVKESNTMATQLGRCVKFEASLVTYIPESTLEDPLSPIEELLTQKQTELMVRVMIHNPRTDMRREWYWEVEPFSDRIAGMRLVWQKWMLEQVMCQQHVPEDPFWSPPIPQLIGTSYLYLAPLAYSASCSQWVPIVNQRGEKQGELRVHLTPHETDGKTPLKLSETPQSLLGKPLQFTLHIEQARGLMDCPNKNVRVEFTFSDEEGKRVTPPAMGKKFDPKFGEQQAFTMAKVTERDLTYLCKDAICFEVWGEIDDVEETDVSEAVAMELPPETFEFFIAHDFVLADSDALCEYDPGMGGAPQGGHVLAQKVAHRLVFSIAQADKHFKVCEVGRARVGNVRDGAGKSVDTSWSTLRVAKQGRASDADPWVVECDFVQLPKKLQEGGAVGQTFQIQLQAEVQEVERLGLEEPLQLDKTLTVTIAAPGKGPTAPPSEPEAKRRYRGTTIVQEIYMGQFEVADAAVNLAMMALRDQSAEGTADVLADHEGTIDLLKRSMVEECARQYEDLALRAGAVGFDLSQSLQLWQLPSELLGVDSAGGPQDVDGLKKQVAELKGLLQAANERIAYLESASGANRAQNQIAALRKQMLDKRMERAGAAAPAVDPKSKACVIS